MTISAEIEQLKSRLERQANGIVVQDPNDAHYPSKTERNYRECNFTQPLDHFDGSTNVTFQQRYFLATQWYESGAALRNRTEDGREIVPVILYDGGETTLEERTNVLDNGIVSILAKATGGIGVLLEHRYYGTSIPNRTELGPGEDWGVDELRWLDTRQSLEDSANFVRKIHFEGVPKDAELRVIYYGGSYAGARAAFVRELYPDQIWGAIASSAVVAATVQLPEYYYAIARGSSASCSQALQRAIAAVDRVIAPEPEWGSRQRYVNYTQAHALTALFGLSNVPTLNDFANLLTMPLGSFQALSWLQDGRSTAWSEFCGTLTNSTLIQSVRSKHAEELDVLGRLPDSVLGYAAYAQEHLSRHCRKGLCSTQDIEHFRNDHGKLSTNKAWQFQICNEYGYYQVAPPISNVTGSPPKPSGPKVVSSRIDEHWMSVTCRHGFTPGQHWTIPARPNVTAVNRIGNMGLHTARLAIIDGQYDPWRPMTQHSDEYAYGGLRDDTMERPFKLIPHCWHHCDSDGLADMAQEPQRIQDIHRSQIAFVRHWLRV
ncbi:hypothetical protein MOBT1_000290 [Malassezia obtusa]|uniref:Serine carboxypeptidase S28 n=1 Tax=Malassezia obtusa TaxID=76774 RepID=A0AAF0DX98_9BASI|nr:hypothetical protein MOBT1_000290 [Malassezia obtusa]